MINVAAHQKKKKDENKDIGEREAGEEKKKQATDCQETE